MTDETELTAEERAEWREFAVVETRYGVSAHEAKLHRRVLRLLGALEDAERERDEARRFAEVAVNRRRDAEREVRRTERAYMASVSRELAAERARTPATPWDVLAINPIRTPATTAPTAECSEQRGSHSRDGDVQQGVHDAAGVPTVAEVKRLADSYGDAMYDCGDPDSGKDTAWMERERSFAAIDKLAARAPTTAEPPADSSGAMDWPRMTLVERLRAEVAALRADRDRLDWIERHGRIYWTAKPGTFRECIDDARRHAPDEAAPSENVIRVWDVSASPEIPFAAQREAELRATERPVPRPTR